jgi:PTS system mannose-specific IID component
MDRRILLRTFLRTYLVGAAFNTKGMQNVGLAYIMDPALQVLFGHDPEELRQARDRYTAHYNTHPFWTPLLTGIFLSMEKKIAEGLLSPQILPALRSTTVYTLSALGDSFFGGSFLVTWSLVGVNLAVCGYFQLLGLWMGLCLVGLQIFKAYTFSCGYSQGVTFLQRLKSWNLIDWGQHLKVINGLLLAVFLLQIMPPGQLHQLAWMSGVGLLAVAGSRHAWDRVVILMVLFFCVLFTPWNGIFMFFDM